MCNLFTRGFPQVHELQTVLEENEKQKTLAITEKDNKLQQMEAELKTIIEREAALKSELDSIQSGKSGDFLHCY